MGGHAWYTPVTIDGFPNQPCPVCGADDRGEGHSIVMASPVPLDLYGNPQRGS